VHRPLREEGEDGGANVAPARPPAAAAAPGSPAATELGPALEARVEIRTAPVVMLVSVVHLKPFLKLSIDM
jgi:hypothetical protein